MQKLEPQRDSLSGGGSGPSSLSAAGGRTESYLPSQPAAGPRTSLRACSLCRCDDTALVVQGEFDALGHAKLEHSVTIELRYLKAGTEAEARKQITPHRAKYGWRYKLFQGKHAMERFICRPCLRESDTMAADWARKKRGDQPRTNQDKFYSTLCGE